MEEIKVKKMPDKRLLSKPFEKYGLGSQIRFLNVNRFQVSFILIVLLLHDRKEREQGRLPKHIQAQV